MNALSFDVAKIELYFGTIPMKNRMFRYLFSPLLLLFSFLFRCLVFQLV